KGAPSALLLPNSPSLPFSRPNSTPPNSPPPGANGSPTAASAKSPNTSRGPKPPNSRPSPNGARSPRSSPSAILSATNGEVSSPPSRTTAGRPATARPNSATHSEPHSEPP